MKVNRQNLSESYRTTSEWVSDFEKALEKKGNYLDNLKTIFRNRNDFSTIEEKMADIRDRAGFELIKETEDTSIAKKASECNSCDGACKCDGCSCNKSKCKTCNSELIDKVKKVLNYMQAVFNDRPETGKHAIITECRNNPDLGFHEIESKLDPKKFHNLLDAMFSKSKTKEEEVKYIPVSGDDYDGPDTADYFDHAQTSGKYV